MGRIIKIGEVKEGHCDMCEKNDFVTSVSANDELEVNVCFKCSLSFWREQLEIMACFFDRKDANKRGQFIQELCRHVQDSLWPCTGTG